MASAVQIHNCTIYLLFNYWERSVKISSSGGKIVSSSLLFCLAFGSFDIGCYKYWVVLCFLKWPFIIMTCSLLISGNTALLDVCLVLIFIQSNNFLLFIGSTISHPTCFKMFKVCFLETAYRCTLLFYPVWMWV